MTISADKVEMLVSAVGRILRADREQPEFGLCDCIDNDGEHYQSADLAAALMDAREALSPASVDTRPKDEDANAASLASGAVGEAEAPNPGTSQPHTSGEQG